MGDTHSLTGFHIPDLDIDRLTRSIHALFFAILTRALKDIFKPSYSDHEIHDSATSSHFIYWPGLYVNISKFIFKLITEFFSSFIWF